MMGVPGAYSTLLWSHAIIVVAARWMYILGFLSHLSNTDIHLVQVVI
jgi:hypothetical protein